VANKQPELGRRARAALQGFVSTVRLLDGSVVRDRFLDELARSRVTVFFPNEREGFYLPALEGMAAGTLVVCPDCVGNRSFCVNDRTALRPDHNFDDVMAAARAAISLERSQRQRILDAAAEMASAHDLAQERRRFFDVLDHVDELWAR
jgi:glycosyltransferase involved in cell wall biosynthesis